jgi:hypothetical protein
VITAGKFGHHQRQQTIKLPIGPATASYPVHARMGSADPPAFRRVLAG